MSEGALTAARQRIDRVAQLLERDSGPVSLLETHISWVLLTRDKAYKFRKPVSLPFVDFSTLAARRHDCDEEVRLNRRLAPSLYLGVTAVTAGSGHPELDGNGAVLDVAVCMHRFPDGALWSELIGRDRLTADHVVKLASTVSQFHQKAPVAAAGSEYGDFAAIDKVTRDLVRNIEALNISAESTATATGAGWAGVREWLLNSLQELKPVFVARQEEGWVRECHGDLHLRNVVQYLDLPTPFDALEFDPALRWIDVISDIAFMAMDLMAHRRPDLAWRLINAYLEDSGDYQGLRVLRFYLVSRALVRFQVMMLTGRQGVADAHELTAADYLQVAQDVIEEADPRLAVMYGLPGTGKTTVSSRFIESTGAIRVRSDVERKRLLGLKASDSTATHGEGSAYVASMSERTYARLLELAELILREGYPVIIDAAFLKREQRAPFARLARDLQIPFAIVCCEAPVSVLRERIEKRQRRGDDASEADVAVLEKLRGVTERPGVDEPGPVLTIDTTNPGQIEEAAICWRAQSRPA